MVVDDAMFCQRDVCEKILERGGDYPVIVKGNQPTLQRGMPDAFVIPKASGTSPACSLSSKPFETGFGNYELLVVYSTPFSDSEFFSARRYWPMIRHLSFDLPTTNTHAPFLISFPSPSNLEKL